MILKAKYTEGKEKSNKYGLKGYLYDDRKVLIPSFRKLALNERYAFASVDMLIELGATDGLINEIEKSPDVTRSKELLINKIKKGAAREL